MPGQHPTSSATVFAPALVVASASNLTGAGSLDEQCHKMLRRQVFSHTIKRGSNAPLTPGTTVTSCNGSGGKSREPQSNGERPMMFIRAHHIIAVVAVLLVGVGVKLIFFAPPTAEADSLSNSVRVDIAQIHRNTKHLPVATIHDMSSVFSAGD
jgi:hypothetical protein